MRRPRPTFIDVFAGCGGLSLGLLNAGWRGLFAIEKSSDAFSTLSYNLLHSNQKSFRWPDWLPKTEHSIEELLRKYRNGMKSLSGKVDLMAGGPPCQGFSTFGRRNASDPRNQLFRRYLEVVELLRPKMLLMENVRGILAPFKGEGAPRDENNKPLAYADIIRNALEPTYAVWSQIIHAKDCGVPQNRPRFILVGCRKDLLTANAPDPFATFREMRSTFLADKHLPTSPITVEEALSDLTTKCGRVYESPDTKGYQSGGFGKRSSPYQDLMHTGMNGGIADSHRFAKHQPTTVEKFVWFQANCSSGKKIAQSERGKHTNRKSVICVLDPRQPAPTVTTLPDDMIHFSEPRILTVREMARLQSFPDWFQFKGKYTTGGEMRVKECPRYTQVGNAVPPLLAEAIGTMLRHYKRAHVKQ